MLQICYEYNSKICRIVLQTCSHKFRASTPWVGVVASGVVSTRSWLLCSFVIALSTLFCEHCTTFVYPLVASQHEVKAHFVSIMFIQ